MTILWLHQGKTMTEVSALLDYAYPSVFALKKNLFGTCFGMFVRKGRPVGFSGAERAKITALACSDIPERRAKWSLCLLSDKVVELELVKSISHTQVKNILKKMN